MSTTDQKLASISEQLKKGVASPQESVRSLLDWFGASRRGTSVVSEIRQNLAKHGLDTVPDFEYAYIDDDVTFVAISTNHTSQTQQSTFSTPDPTYRVGRLQPANTEPISVKPDSTLSQVVTIMLTNDFSQVPVMTSPREVKGVVSWKTIGTRLALQKKCIAARDCMEPASIISSDESLFSAIAAIAAHDYVLVKASPNDARITGIITASDFNEQFRKLAEPFLLVGEIENGLRRMLHGRFSATELAATKAPGDETRKIDAVSDLTFGEYLRLIEPEENWKKVQLEIDRVEFIKGLDRIRLIRNDVMHFDPDGLSNADLRTLREFAGFLRRLRDVGAM